MVGINELVLADLAAWAAGRLDGIEHERRVAKLADRLFLQTQPLHGLGEDHRILLSAMAIVHDVGRCACDKTHPADGARMILASPLIHLRHSARRALAFATLYHRGRVPEAGQEAILTTADDRPSLRLLLAMLRAADALDSRRGDNGRVSLFMGRGKLHILGARRVKMKKMKLLEAELGLEVAVQPGRSLRKAA